jgi:hypothetical protein
VFGPYASYCEEFARLNGNNLLLNGDFAVEPDIGWNWYPNVVPGLEVDRVVPDDYSAVALKVVTPPTFAEPVKICQRIPLFAGEMIEFTGDIKIMHTGTSPVLLRPLYIGWVEKSKPHGNSSKPIPSSTWNRYSRIFQLPKDSSSRVYFCPIEITGTAIVWLANMHVATVPSNNGNQQPIRHAGSLLRSACIRFCFHKHRPSS